MLLGVALIIRLFNLPSRNVLISFNHLSFIPLDRVIGVVNPRRACAARVTVLGLCVCLSVDDYSRTTGYEAAYERYSFSATRA